MKYRNGRILVCITLSVALLSGQATAGYNSNANVTVHPTWASGQVTDARLSGDSNQKIGCYLTDDHLQCYATDRDGNRLVCDSSDPSSVIRDAVGSIGPASRIDFYVAYPSICRTVYVRNDSANL